MHATVVLSLTRLSNAKAKALCTIAVWESGLRRVSDWSRRQRWKGGSSPAERARRRCLACRSRGSLGFTDGAEGTDGRAGPHLQRGPVDAAWLAEGQEAHVCQQQTGGVDVVRDAEVAALQLRVRTLLPRARPKPAG